MTISEQEARHILSEIHASINLLHGDHTGEYDEQLMSVMFIPKNARVLEIGGNVGRNSCTISRILEDSKNLVVVESDHNSVAKLIANRDHNNLKFNIVAGAISKVPMYQTNWDTREWDGVSAIPSNGFIVNTVTWSDVVSQYGNAFDTLVLDCEGAFYYIVKEEPAIMDTIKRVLIENDFHHKEHKDYVDNILVTNGFKRVYCKSNIWPGICQHNFYETWIRD